MARELSILKKMLSSFSLTHYIFSFTPILGKTHTINYHKKVDYASIILYNFIIRYIGHSERCVGESLMPQPRKRMDITSADKQQIGFDYQYLYFMLQLLHMEPGETVGYEAFDDVHRIDATQKKTTYIQVKHTIDATADGAQASLTRLSGDLWKTLSNWSVLITDPVDGRTEKNSQLAFVDNANFILVVNRKVDGNDVVKKIHQARYEQLTGTAIKTYLRSIKSQTSDASIKAYINNVYSLPTPVILAFFKNIIVVDSSDDIFKEIREGIRRKMISSEYVDDVFSSLYLQLKEDFFKNVQNKTHQIITYDDWLKKYCANFNTYRETLLPLREYHPVLPEHLEQQTFVKELIEIGAIDMAYDGLAEIAELTQFYLIVELQLDDWYDDGKITLAQRNNFHKDAVLIWKRIHQSCHRKTRNDMSQDDINALSCYDDVMRAKLSIVSTGIGLQLSNGEFIKLANEAQIGWKYKWKGRYT